MSKVREYLSTLNPDAVFFDGLDSAIIGIGRQHPNLPVVVYSQARIINELERDMDPEGAEEWYAHNIMCLGVGDNTPIIIEEWIGLEQRDMCVQVNLN